MYNIYITLFFIILASKLSLVDFVSGAPSSSKSDVVTEDFLMEKNNPTMEFFEKESFPVEFVLNNRCGRLIDQSTIRGLGQHKLLLIGNYQYPATLVITLEKRVVPFISELMKDWCSSKDQDIVSILSHSCMMFLISHVADGPCGEYHGLASLEPIITQIESIFRPGLTMMFGTGGVKLRYVASTNGLSERLAERYQQFHESMGYKNTEICASYKGSVSTAADDMLLRSVLWSSRITSSSNAALRQLEALVIQVACCYEPLNYEQKYQENRKAFLETMKLRTTGINIETEFNSIVKNDRGLPNYSLRSRNPTFILLPEGVTTLSIVNRDNKKLNTIVIHFKLDNNSRFLRRKVKTDGSVLIQ